LLRGSTPSRTGHLTADPGQNIRSRSELLTADPGLAFSVGFWDVLSLSGVFKLFKNHKTDDGLLFYYIIVQI